MLLLRDSDGDVSVGVDGSPRDNLAAGDASLVDVYINLSNRGNDPAFGSMLNITIPSIFTFARVNPAEVSNGFAGLAATYMPHPHTLPA